MSNRPTQLARHDEFSDSLSKKIPPLIYNEMSNPPAQLARNGEFSNPSHLIDEITKWVTPPAKTFKNQK